ncbi:hypothetical protein NVP1189B_26 [Vibrio phage 1.189.B._10N.286.51.B5]|nr:hypothetical protein NVP1189B_26 [Vibrio phage 1.189.B._10N.286.51.B5]AUR93918.1 hypothetical protein NVP1189C_26 [Vibrio phage 1.189.C._10N.286.51.B5]AUR93984.1 hypothetical protein NVP1189O_26 [Vibrio phage 1.189.O._10N.286.51.B5]
MRFIELINHRDGWVRMIFDQHDASEACIGDQIWSDGRVVEVYEGADWDVVYEFMGFVENAALMHHALVRVGVWD